MIDNIFKMNDPSGKYSNEKHMSKNYPKIYKNIIDYSNLHSLSDLTYSQKTYHYINDLNKIPKCLNENCNNITKYKNRTLGYHVYCSLKCSSSCDKIRSKIKNTCQINYGTNTPCENPLILEKMINTNIDRYGGSSPQCDKTIHNKSKKTLMINYGVDNPSKSKEILSKRIKSFKINIDKYKYNFKSTMLSRYGEESPFKLKGWRIRRSEINNENNMIKYNKELKNSKILNYILNSETNSYDILLECFSCYDTSVINKSIFNNRFKKSPNRICTNCNPISDNSSLLQLSIIDDIKMFYDGIILENDKNALKPFEIDIYLPEIKVGIEINGLYWHSEIFKTKNYHYEKYLKSIDNNIKLYSFWEDEIINDRNLFLKMIQNIFIHKVKLNTPYNFNMISEFEYNISTSDQIISKINIDISDEYLIINNFENYSEYNTLDIFLDYLNINNLKVKIILDNTKKFDDELIDNLFILNKTIKPGFFIIKNKKRIINSDDKSYKVYNAGYSEYIR